VQAPDAAGFGAHILQSIISERRSCCETGACRAVTDCAGIIPAPACKRMNATAAIQQTILRAKLFRIF
jgi:hypothetical protein